jgi:Type IV secretion-system coupling protein DNA-binding domain
MTSHLSRARPGPSPAPPGGPPGRYLTNPGGYTGHLARLLLAALAHYGPVAGPLLAVAVTAVIAGRPWLRRRQHAAFADAARQVTILAPPQADPAGAEALWGHLTGLLRPPWARLWHGQPHMGWEYAWAGGTAAGMVIRMWVPGTIPPGLIERAIEAAWPGAHTVTAPAGPPLPPGAVTAGGTLRLARPDILPLSAGYDPEAPLRALAGAAASLADGEHAVLQVLTRPVTGARLRKARRAARKQRAGQSARITSRLLDLASPGGHGTSRSRTASRPDPELAAEIRETTAKLAGPQWETLIRYAVATTAPAQARDGASRWEARAAAAQQAARLRGLAHALASATALFTGRNWLARRRLRRPAAAIISRRLTGGDLLSVPELAAIARLPGDPSLPGLARAGARAVPPPPAIPVPGPHVRPLGISDAGAPRPVGLAVPDARHHLRICGPTGTGKTTLIAGQILADAQAGRGVVFIDPKGDAVTDIIARLPEETAGKVVLFDPGDARHAPPCLNVLQGDGSGTDTDMIVDNVTGIFRRIFAGFWGPRTDDIFRAACLTLLGSVPPGSGLVTLADIPPLLGDDAYRRRLTAGVRDQVLRDFWTWYEEMSPASRAHAVGPLMNKLRAFLLRKFAHAAIAAGPSTFDMAEVLDNGGLCLARLPKGILGEETAQLVGSFIVARTWQAASRRARLPETARADAGLYIDECQNFLNLPYPLEDMLAEARAYRLSVVMAHQNLAQLPPDLRQGISANARSQVIFSVSPEDARDLEHHTAPVLTAHDLSHLGAYQAAARLVAGSDQTPAFTFRTRPLPPPVPGRARLIRRAARAAHAEPAGAAPPPPAAGGDPRLRPRT